MINKVSKNSTYIMTLKVSSYYVIILWVSENRFRDDG